MKAPKSGAALAAAAAGKARGKAKADAKAAPARAAAPQDAGEAVKPRFKERYHAGVVKALMEQFSYGSAMQVPRLLKITLNAGLGRAVSNAGIIKIAQSEMADIAGQRPVICRAKKSIANFKLREGQPIGCMVTLRRDRMWEFFDRLVLVAIPRIRDFHGLNPKSFDGRGNYNFSVKEQLLFPEIVYDKVTEPIGMSITFTTTAKTDTEGRALLAQFGMPFRS